MADDSLAEAIDAGEAIETVSPPASPCTQAPGFMQIGTRDCGQQNREGQRLQ